LEDLYAGFDSRDFIADYEGLGGYVERINAYAASLKTFADVSALVGEIEQYYSAAQRIGEYAGFVFSADTGNQEAAKYLYKIETLDAEISRARVRLSAYLAEAERSGGMERQAEAHGLGEYIYQFKRMAEQSKHQMSEDEEALTAKLTATGSSAWGMLRDKLISDLKCDYDGKKITVNECRNLAYSNDAKVRKAAYEAELAAYPKIAESAAACINGIKGEVNLLTGLRHFESPLAQALFGSAMTQKTLDAMFAAIDGNIRHFRDYFKAKAAYLAKISGAAESGAKAEGLPFYDLFAPVGAAPDKVFTYDDAKKFVLENFGRFSPKLAETAREAFDRGWIDVYPREGKVGGAFCGHVYAIKQFRILMNFGDSISDAITLAHELGHGYHSMNVMKERILNAEYPMPLAETASTFCENVVNNAALAVLPDGEKFQMLENSIQDAAQVIVDIYSRYLFEKRVFETRSDHPLSVEELNGLMLDAQKAAYGDGLDPEYMHPYMWVIKPHYYSGQLSFYNFPYAFGNLLANGLYKIYESDPASFGDKYDAFLNVTGKMSVRDACAQIGVDVEQKRFWENSLSVIIERIKEFERLAATAV
jgi:pepF/M3 family oligoendopeptidase